MAPQCLLSESQKEAGTVNQPLDLPAAQAAPDSMPFVVIKAVSPKIGRGVFAGRDFKHRELIFQERPILKATHDSFHAASTKDAPIAYFSLSSAERLLLRAAFTVLARVDITAAPFPNSTPPDIASKLREPATAQIDISTDSEAAFQPAALRHGVADSHAILKWFTAYAFRLPESQGRHRAAVYLVGSLVNHACGDWNAHFNFAGDELRVVAKRDIRQGDEISINYGQARRVFDCLCEDCKRNDGWLSGSSCLRSCFPN